MKSKLSILALISSAVLPCGNVLVGADSPVSVYDSTGALLVSGEDFSIVGSVLNNVDDSRIILSSDILNAGSLQVSSSSNSETYISIESANEIYKNISGRFYLKFSGNNSPLHLSMNKLSVEEEGTITTTSLLYLEGDSQFSGTFISSSKGVEISPNSKFTFESNVPTGRTIFQSPNIIFHENASVSFSNIEVDAGSADTKALVVGNVTINRGANVTFSNLLFKSSDDAYGAAIDGDVIFESGSIATFSSIENHGKSAAWGGVINGNAHFKNGSKVTFKDNTTTSSSYGGTIFGNVVVEKGAVVEFSGNTSYSGGAIYGAEGNCIIAGEVIFYGNTAQNVGGAIYVHGAPTLGGSIKFENNSAEGNGGAVATLAKEVTIASGAVLE